MYRVGSALLLLALIAGCLYTVFHNQQWGYDDAFISYRYAANLSEGHGLVFNPGERVEGYSNLLYVLVIALGLSFLPADAVYGFSVAINILCLVGALWMLMRVLRRRLGEGRALVAGLLIALSPPLWYAAWTGMETCLVVFFFTCTWASLSRLGVLDTPETTDGPALLPPLGLLCGSAAALALTRADGALLVAPMVAYLVLRRQWALAIRVSAAVALAVSGQLVWRLYYYGDPLPNTYYVKVSGSLADRLSYAAQSFAGFVELFPYLAAIALWAGVVLLDKRRRGESFPAWVEFAALFTVAWLIYWFYVGGDIFGMRFLLVLFPLGAASLAHLLPADRPASGLSRLGLGAVLVLLLALPFSSLGANQLVPERTSYDPWSVLGRFLGARHPEALIAVDGAGKIPYYSKLPTIDMLGLSDRHIARRPTRFKDPGHSKSDPTYVLQRRPELIAARVSTPRFDLDPGLSVERYRGAGYRLVYLLYIYPDPPGDPIVLVDELSLAERRALLRRGYLYAVLGRKPAD